MYSSLHAEDNLDTTQENRMLLAVVTEKENS